MKGDWEDDAEGGQGKVLHDPWCLYMQQFSNGLMNERVMCY